MYFEPTERPESTTCFIVIETAKDGTVKPIYFQSFNDAKAYYFKCYEKENIRCRAKDDYSDFARYELAGYSLVYECG